LSETKVTETGEKPAGTDPPCGPAFGMVETVAGSASVVGGLVDSVGGVEDFVAFGGDAAKRTLEVCGEGDRTTTNNAVAATAAATTAAGIHQAGPRLWSPDATVSALSCT